MPDPMPPREVGDTPRANPEAERLLAELEGQATDPITSEHYPDAAEGYKNARVIVRSMLPDILREERRSLAAHLREQLAVVDAPNIGWAVAQLLNEIEAPGE